MASVLITGGTGSFGRAFVRWALAQPEPAKICILSRDELKQSEMATEFNSPRLRFFLGDVRDRDRLTRAFHSVDTVLHAAALKQVPKAVRTNVLGTRNVIEAALDAGIGRVLLLSTDKACSPSTLYGATKLTAERMIIAANALAGGTRTLFAAVRYGNVAGSRGSVIPLWQEALWKRRALPVTDLGMTRFYMSQADAVSLVLLAVREMTGGEVFIPKLRSYLLADLAEAMAGQGYPMDVIGIRGIEKMHETLIDTDECRNAYEHEGHHYRILPAPEVHPWRRAEPQGPALTVPYRSDGNLMTVDEIKERLRGL
jgi:UDP-N-acetylglucosamine 4,6-dehydratase/5-epimerase